MVAANDMLHEAPGAKLSQSSALLMLTPSHSGGKKPRIWLSGTGLARLLVIVKTVERPGSFKFIIPDEGLMSSVAREELRTLIGIEILLVTGSILSFNPWMLSVPDPVVSPATKSSSQVGFEKSKPASHLLLTETGRSEGM